MAQADLVAQRNETRAGDELRQPEQIRLCQRPKAPPASARDGLAQSCLMVAHHQPHLEFQAVAIRLRGDADRNIAIPRQEAPDTWETMHRLPQPGGRGRVPSQP